ncbi:MAG: SDR family oxidoreductase [Pseudomonadota bacterium]
MKATYPSLKDRPVVISGGASGIGEALVRGFANQGARVGFVDVNKAAGQALADEVGARFIACDVTDIPALQGAIARFAETHGPAHVLVNNAANDLRHDWAETSEADWSNHVDVNLKHHFFAIQAVAPAMIEAKAGSIINFGSIGWMIPEGVYPCYATSKAATHGLTRSFAKSLGGHGIRVNTIVPGWVMTQRQLEKWVDEAAEARIDASQCLAGRVQPDDIAAMVLFLAADDSRMCSAQNYIVDGGWI